MKRNVYLLIAVAFSMIAFGGNAFAQKKFVNKAATWASDGVKLDTALKLVNAAESNDETKDWAKTYYVKGLVYEAIDKSTDANFKSVCDKCDIDAFDYFKKAYYMEGSKMYQSSIDLKLLNMLNAFVNKAITAYQEENFTDAFTYFEKSLEVKEMPIFEGEVDTAIIFNTALTAQRIGKYDEAAKYYKKAIEYNYGGGDTYAYLAEDYKAAGDKEAHINAYKEGFEKYPENQSLLGGIINYYILDEENPDEAFKYLKLARENDPNNPQFYSAEAHLYDKVGDKDNAIAKYKKAIEINPNFFEAYYNLGVIYYNWGVELNDKANEIMDNKKFEAAKAEADKKFAESLPYIEKAHELQPGDTNIMSTLKNIYYRLQMNDKYEEISKEME